MANIPDRTGRINAFSDISREPNTEGLGLTTNDGVEITDNYGRTLLVMSIIWDRIVNVITSILDKNGNSS